LQAISVNPTIVLASKKTAVLGAGDSFVVSSDREPIRLNTLCQRAAERSDLGVVAGSRTFFRYSLNRGLGFDQFWDPLLEDDAQEDEPDTDSESWANW
jgi:hypothetical protein